VPGTDTPNIVIVLADDLGWADTGCYGAAAIPTPTIDSLAARGVRFVDAHAASAVCTPSRYALMTGRYPWRSRLKSGVLGGFDPPLIPEGQATLASELKTPGRVTGYFGKWHLGLSWTRTAASSNAPGRRFPDSNDEGRDVDYGVGFSGGPVALGFDRFFGLAASYDMAPYCFLEDDHTVGIPTVEKVTIGGQRPGLTVDGWVDDQADLVITDEATKWIGDQIADGSPFLAILGTLSPHRPCVPPDEFRGRSNAGNRGDAVTLVDDLLRRVLETIEPVAEDTIVIFTSDNGAPMNYPEDGDTFHHRPNGPWRGQKADIWEAGHRVPLIVAGPGIASGETCSATVSLLDLLPTLLDIDGVANPCGLDGESFAEMLSAPETTEQTSRLLGMQALNGMLALRYGSRKAIFGTGSGGFTELRGEVGFGPDDAGQLYDLSDDPGERHNRWREAHAEARSKLSSFADAAGFDAAEHGPN